MSTEEPKDKIESDDELTDEALDNVTGGTKKDAPAPKPFPQLPPDKRKQIANDM